MHRSYYEANARDRIEHLCDPHTFVEFCPPQQRFESPHLGKLGLPASGDDGVAVGKASIEGRPVLIASQDATFYGGAVGEVHGAKITGLLQRAVAERPDAVILLIDSGGVRLQEANAGLIGISEIMRALFSVRNAGIPVVALVGGSCGAFGGMGIVSRLCDAIVMSEKGRLGLSGPEVIEAVKGLAEFDSHDRALVWRVTGGKLRRALGEAVRLVDDDIAAFRAAAAELMTVQGMCVPRPAALYALLDEHERLAARAARFAVATDGIEIFRAAGFDDAESVNTLPVTEFNRIVKEIT